MPTLESDSYFMRLALQYAWQFQTLTLPNPAVGALIVCQNKIIALQAHKKAGSPHAEVLASKEAFLYKMKHDKKAKTRVIELYKKENPNAKHAEATLIRELESLHDSLGIHTFIAKYHSGILSDCEFFVTLEPCNHYGKTPPCAKLLATIKPKRIIIAHKDHTKARGGIHTLESIPLTQHVLWQEAHNLLFPFLQWQKNNGFMLFKIAHTLHGRYKNGFISNQDSRIFTHNMRAVADYIVISGATLREDNPLLDTRFAESFYAKNAKVPQILILSQKMQEGELATFHIANKHARIIRSVNEIPKEGFKIIEGGFSFLHSLLKDIAHYKAVPIDCIMGYIAPQFLLHEAIFNSAKDSLIQDSYKLLYTTTLPSVFSNTEPASKENNILYYLFLDEGGA